MEMRWDHLAAMGRQMRAECTTRHIHGWHLQGSCAARSGSRQARAAHSLGPVQINVRASEPKLGGCDMVRTYALVVCGRPGGAAAARSQADRHVRGRDKRTGRR